MMLVLEDWQLYSFILSFIGIIVSLILYLISKILNEPMFLQYAKEEMGYAITTVLMVFVIVFLLFPVSKSFLIKLESGIIEDIFVQSTGTQQSLPVSTSPFHSSLNIEDPYDGILLIFDSALGCIKSYISYLRVPSIFLYPAASVYQEIWMSEPLSGGAYNVVTNRISITIKSATFYTWVYYIIRHILMFVKEFWSLLLTIGVVFRAFAPTRGAGAFLIALSLAFYIILPISYFLGLYTTVVFYRSYITNPVAATLPTSSQQGQNILPCDLGPAINNLHNQVSCSERVPLSPASATYVNNKAKMYVSPSEGGGLKSIVDAIFGWSTRLFSLLYSMFCMLPMVVLVLVITFALSSTTLFGGTIPEISRGIVRLL